MCTLTTFADLPSPWLKSLVQERLSPCYRLSLFRASRDLATTVLQHAGCVQLTLHAACKQPGASRSSSSSSSKHLQAALPALLALAPIANLHVSLRGGLPAAWAAFPRHQVLQLSLERFRLTPNLLMDLQLQQCSSLHTLEVGWHVTMDGHQLAEDCSKWLPSGFTHLKLHSYSFDAAEAITQLANAQVTRMTVDLICALQLPQTVQYVQARLPFSLQFLTHFQAPQITDALLTMLSWLPSLSHVTADCLLLKEDHFTKHLKWQQLELKGFGCVKYLHRLPLQGIQRIQTHAFIVTAGASEENTSRRLASYQGMRCVPKRHITGWLAQHQPQQGIFTVTGECDAVLLHMVVKGLSYTRSTAACKQIDTGATAAARTAGVPQPHGSLQFMQDGSGLHLSSFSPVTAAEQLLPCLAQLPQHITMLVLRVQSRGIATEAAALQLRLACWAQVLATIPEHVCVVLGPTSDDTAEHSMAVKYELQQLMEAHPGRVFKPEGL